MDPRLQKLADLLVKVVARELVQDFNALAGKKKPAWFQPDEQFIRQNNDTSKND